jgi:spermidine synthase/MFS family permease
MSASTATQSPASTHSENQSLASNHRPSQASAYRQWLILMLTITLIANAAILVCQQVAIRLLAPTIGSSIETWSSVLGVFLLGIALGNFIACRFADHYSPKHLILISLILGGFSVWSMPYIAGFFESTHCLATLPLSFQIIIASIAVCLLPGIALSLITPPSIRSLVHNPAQAGAISGSIFALGTLGSLLGNYLTGFVFLAFFGLDTIILATTLALVLLAGLVVLLGSANHSDLACSAIACMPKSNECESQQAVQALSQRTPSSTGLPILQAIIIVTACSFVSGALEGAAFRILAPMVGVSMFLTAGVVGVVLTGMSAGNWIGGRIATQYGTRDALKRSLMLASLSTIFVAVIWSTALEFGIFDALPMIPKVIAWSFSLFLVPALALGLITPQVIGLCIRDVRSTGAITGKLYGFSTLGCIAGILASAWVFVESFGAVRSCLLCGLIPLGLVWMLATTEAGRIARLTIRQALMATLLAVGLFATHQSPYDDESKYFALKVTEATLENRKLQCFTLDHLVHSCIDLDDPTFLFYKHEQIQADLTRAAAVQARAEGHTPRILVIGGGGYSYPRWLESQADLQDVIIDVVEIDPAVTEMAHNKLGLSRQTRINSFHMDGRQYVKAAPAHSYDLVIQDAVNDLSVPYHLMTQEYTQLIQRLLRPERLYLLTVIDNFDTGRFLGSAVRTCESVFERSNLLLPAKPAPDTRKVFVIASRNGGVNPAADQFYTQVERENMRDSIYHVPRVEVEGLLSRCRDVSPLLTDNFAPVDMLMAEQFIYRNRNRESSH